MTESRVVIKFVGVDAGLERTAKQGSTGLESFRDSSGRARDEFGRFIKTAGEATDELQRTTSVFGNFNAAIAGFAGGAAFAILDQIINAFAAAGAAVTQFIAETVALGNAADQSRVAFETILGSAEEAERVLADLTDFAATTPFEFTGVREAGQQLLAFNFEANELRPTLTALGDVAAGTSTNFNELVEIYGKARVQGRLFQEDINQLTGRGIPIIQEFAKQFGVTESEVRKLVESGQIGFPQLEQAFVSMTSEGGQFFNLMEAQSQTFGGQLSNLGDSLDQFKISLFNAFEPALSGGLATFADILAEAGAQSQGLDAIAASSERLREALEGNPELVERIGAALAVVFDAGIEQVASLTDGFTKLLENDAAIEEFSQRIEDFAVVITAAGETVRFLLELTNGIAEIEGAAESIPIFGDRFAAAMKGPIGPILDLLGRIGDLIEVTTRVRDRVQDFLSPAVDSVLAFRESVIDAALGPLDDLIERFSEVRSQALQTIGILEGASGLESFGQGLSAGVDTAQRGLEGLAAAAGNVQIEFIGSDAGVERFTESAEAIAREEERLQQARLDAIDEASAEAVSIARRAELARQAELATLRRDGFIAEEEYQLELANETVKRIDRELEAESDRVRALIGAGGSEQEIRQAKETTAKLALDLIEAQRQAEQRLIDIQVAAINRRLQAQENEAQRQALLIQTEARAIQGVNDAYDRQLALLRSRANLQDAIIGAIATQFSIAASLTQDEQARAAIEERAALIRVQQLERSQDIELTIFDLTQKRLQIQNQIAQAQVAADVAANRAEQARARAALSTLQAEGGSAEQLEAARLQIVAAEEAANSLGLRQQTLAAESELLREQRNAERAALITRQVTEENQARAQAINAIADDERRNELAAQERRGILGVEDIGRVFQRENDRLIEELARSRNFGVSNERVPGGTLNYLLRNQRDLARLPERSFTQPVQLIPQSSLVQPLANVPQFTPQGATSTPAIAPTPQPRIVNFTQDNTVNVTVQGQQATRDIEDAVFSAIADASTEARRQLEAQ